MNSDIEPGAILNSSYHGNSDTFFVVLTFGNHDNKIFSLTIWSGEMRLYTAPSRQGTTPE